MTRRTKASVRDLAICGSTPMFDTPLHVGRPNVGDRDRLLAMFDDLLDRRWFSNHGPYVTALESRISALLGVRHCIATCNATVGLQIVARALDLSGEVIVPAFTFVATAHALSWIGLTPVCCDVDPHTHCIDPRAAERLITPRTSGVVGVHLWGSAAPVESLEGLCRRHGLALMFDAAHALACTYRGRMIGNFGRAEVLSLHATKLVNSFEGGVVTTNDDTLAARIRRMRDFGYAGPVDEVVDLGTNGKMCEPAAAMGLASLDRLDAFVSHNRQVYASYKKGLERVRGIECRAAPIDEQWNHQYVVVEVDAEKAGQSRDELQAILTAENVLARRYFFPGCHRASPYHAAEPAAANRLPVTETLCRRVLVLPTGTAVSPTDASAVCDVIRLALSDPAAVRRLQVGMAGRGGP